MNYSKCIVIPFLVATLSFSLAQEIPRDLALRLARVSEDADLTVGILPADLPLSLSLPKEVGIVGSLKERYEGGEITTLYLTSDAPKERVIEDFVVWLALAGLTALPQGDPWEWGFVPSREPYDVLEFCRDDLFVTAGFDETNREVEVEVRLEASERNFECEQRLEEATMRDEHTPPVPVLSSPADIQTYDMDFGGTFSGHYTSVALEADLDPATLSEHYAAQLERAGWVQVDSSETPSVAWAQWRFEDEAGFWIGFMQIFSSAVFPEQTVAYLYVVQM